MKLSVLIDNNTLIDRYFLGEPGVSFFIEIDELRILFDLGYSDKFLANAAKMGIDLLDIDMVVLSHAHLDHTWGLQHLIQKYTEAGFEQKAFKRPKLLAHPSIFYPRTYPGMGEIGCLVSQETAERYFDLQLSKEPVWIHSKLVFLGEIERTNTFEAKTPIGKIHTPDATGDDFLYDDSALAYRSPDGLVIITGCAHAGICNTLAYADTICDEHRIADIIGGFHLIDTLETQMIETVRFLKQRRPSAVHACHCTDLAAKLALSRVVPLKEVGVGLTLSYD
jgi:7,8-dihydropterin-6-yl-methyl-4-(beta-D-ribofuranosyl)aminobenzene 5'-phosphate synthase